MCYVCRQPVTDYQHFDSGGILKIGGKCLLYEETDARHTYEVNNALETFVKNSKIEIDTNNFLLETDSKKKTVIVGEKG